MTDWNNRIEAFALTDRAIRLQLSDDGELSEVQECLARALQLDPDNIEVLQEAAHIYDAVIPDPQKGTDVRGVMSREGRQNRCRNG